MKYKFTGCEAGGRKFVYLILSPAFILHLLEGVKVAKTLLAKYYLTILATYVILHENSDHFRSDRIIKS
ncbi:hypothetical protein Cylst_6300 (plasmid) [Cylindrospermum stagnale PCC 7417]|uniref:Uncharacterized protein n=1 Tax=Cylindrospermum stagnale PCC 7417 TaxID=56107 RepID=K9X8X5_9NOST|nr:hypothetical protein Cylst_6300 [Cylindrospermum stagnale PCC 7417]